MNTRYMFHYHSQIHFAYNFSMSHVVEAVSLPIPKSGPSEMTVDFLV